MNRRPLAVVLWLAGRALLGGEETGESPRMDRNVYVGAETEAAFVSASAVFALPKEITVQVTPEKADKPARAAKKAAPKAKPAVKAEAKPAVKAEAKPAVKAEKKAPAGKK